MHKSGRILFVNGEANARSALALRLREAGYDVDTAADGEKALPKLGEFDPDVVVTDLKLPGLDGLSLMSKALEQDPDRAVIVTTTFGAIETAVAAMRAGAADYLTKPINFDQLSLVIERALERRRLRQETGQLRQRLTERNRIPSIIGGSPLMQAIFDTVRQIAPSRAAVLITGESGTGKALLAAAIHEHSPRASRPFVRLHCAALSETLLESELFGHERGAFTGAVARHDGHCQQADSGTLLLDEIGEIAPAVQLKLLRFLQEQEFTRVGSNQTIKVDVRIVAATKRNLRDRIQQGLFREDLYYRLNVISVEVPALRQRPSDIGLLAQHFLVKFAQENGKAITVLTKGAMEKLLRYPWPGNVRELENAIERAVITCRGDTLRAEDLAVTAASTEAWQLPSPYPPVPGTSLAELERFAILKTLEHTCGSTSRTAAVLGISPRKIQYKLQAYKRGGPSARTS